MRTPIVMCAVALLSGCATKSEVRNMPSDAGLANSYAVSMDKAKLACKDTLGELGYSVKDDVAHAAGWWRILGSQGLSSGGTGRIIRFMIEDKRDSVVVRVVVQSRVDTAEARAADAAIAEDVHKRAAARMAK